MQRRRGKVALPAAHFDRVQPSLQGQIAMTRRVGLNENRASGSPRRRLTGAAPAGGQRIVTSARVQREEPPKLSLLLGEPKCRVKDSWGGRGVLKQDRFVGVPVSQGNR